MRNHATIIVCTLVLGAAAYSATKPLLHVSCSGAIDVFPNTGATAIHIDPPAKLVFDTFTKMLKERVRQQCPSITDAQYQYGFSYGPGYWLNLFSAKRVWTIPGCNTSIFDERILGVQEIPFDGKRIVVNWPAAESSCSSDGWASGSECAMKVSLPKYGVTGVLKMEHCSNSLWPEISVYCEGTNCDSIAKLCNSNADCPSPATCWHWGLDVDDIWGLATEIGIYSNQSDTKPGCKSVTKMFDELKEYFMSQVFSAAAPVETPDVPICFVNFTALDEDPLDTLGITDLYNVTADYYECKDYCSAPSGVFPPDFPPNFSQMDPGECSYDRYNYYCGYIYNYAYSKGLSMCDMWRLAMACAIKIGCDSTSVYYIDSFDDCQQASCAECTPMPSWNPTDYPPPLIANNCLWEIRNRCEQYAYNWYYYHTYTEPDFNYCHRLELMLNCEHYLNCTESYYNNSCYNEGCDNKCSKANITININIISSYTGTPPSYTAPTAPTISPMVAGSSTLFKHTCDGWIMLFPESTFSIKLHVGHQDILSWLYSWLKAPEDCRAIGAGGSALNWWQFEARFGWLPLALLLQTTVNVPAESELGATISDFRKWFDAPDSRLDIPETCTFAKWREDGKCALKYTGLSSLLQADITLLLDVKKCSASGALPDIQIDCAGSGCQLFVKPIPCATPGSSAECPAGTKCWNLDSEIGDQISNPDLLGQFLFKNPDEHIVSNAFHNMVHTILKALGSGDTTNNNYYCFFAPYGSHLLDVFHNNTFAKDWANAQYKTQGDVLTLVDLKPWAGSSGGSGSGNGDGSDSTDSAGITKVSASLLIITAIINRLLQ